MVKHLNPDDRIRMISNILNDNLDLIKGKIIADIGAGEGSITKLMADYADKVFAVDNNKEVLARLQEKCKNLKNVYTTFSATNKVNLEDRHVDVVISISSFHDLPMGYEKEMGRILKDDGMVVILDWKKEESNQGPPYNIRLSKGIVVNRWNVMGFSKIFGKSYDALYLLVFRR